MRKLSITKKTKIREVLSREEIINTILENDPDTSYGGISFKGETLAHFMNDVHINSDDSFVLLQMSLKRNGIMPLNIFRS